jgi:hypothetical protein
MFLVTRTLISTRMCRIQLAEHRNSGQPSHSPLKDKTMHRFIVREIVSGVLLPLPQLVARLGLVGVVSWRFRDIKFHYGRPFGHTVEEFEHMTRQAKLGYQVSAVDFRDFLKTEFQIIDGKIEAVGEGDKSVMTLDCVDGSQWELATESEELASELERQGFRVQKG